MSVQIQNECNCRRRVPEHLRLHCSTAEHRQGNDEVRGKLVHNEFHNKHDPYIDKAKRGRKARRTEGLLFSRSNALGQRKKVKVSVGVGG